MMTRMQWQRILYIFTSLKNASKRQRNICLLCHVAISLILFVFTDWVTGNRNRMRKKSVHPQNKWHIHCIDKPGMWNQAQRQCEIFMCRWVGERWATFSCYQFELFMLLIGHVCVFCFLKLYFAKSRKNLNLIIDRTFFNWIHSQFLIFYQSYESRMIHRWIYSWQTNVWSHRLTLDRKFPCGWIFMNTEHTNATMLLYNPNPM